MACQLLGPSRAPFSLPNESLIPLLAAFPPHFPNTSKHKESTVHLPLVSLTEASPSPSFLILSIASHLSLPVPHPDSNYFSYGVQFLPSE